MTLSSPPSRISLERLPGTDAPYTLATPATLAAGQRVPLVVSLHYGGPAPPYYGRGLLEQVVEPGLRPLGAIFAAPDCSGPAWAEGACEQNVLALIDHLSASLPIDTGRIVVTGYSKGGIGTWALAAKHRERFSAALVMAGRPPSPELLADWRTPMLAIHGEADEVLPLEPVQAAVESLRETGAPVELRVLPGVTHYETHLFAEALRSALPWLEAALRR